MCTTRIALGCMLVCACQSAETPQQTDARITAESNTARPELAAIKTNMERWFAAGAVDSAATILTEDHSSLPPNQPAGSGRADWVSRTTPLFTTGKFSLHHVTASVVANGPIAVERGRYLMDFVPGPAAPADIKASADTGKYLWHWRKVDGQWLVAAAAWSSDLPVTK